MGRKPYMTRTETMRPEFRPAELALDGLGVIYFLGSEDGTEIKIGYTDNADKDITRRKAHAAYGYRVPLAFVRASKAHEQFIHTYFRERGSAVRGKSEEIHRIESVLPYVVWLRNQYFVAINIEECKGASFVAMDSGFWLPDEQKQLDSLREPDLLSLESPWARLPERTITGDDYYTPPEIIDVVRTFFGQIDLDPASHVHANRIIQAKSFYTNDVNGLALPWFGRVWLNPPFSSWPHWVEKVREEVESGRVTEIVLLAATRTMTAQYFAPLLSWTACLCVITGRFAFWGVNAADSPPDGHFLMYIGNRPEEFRREVGDKLGSSFYGATLRQAS